MTLDVTLFLKRLTFDFIVAASFDFPLKTKATCLIIKDSEVYLELSLGKVVIMMMFNLVIRSLMIRLFFLVFRFLFSFNKSSWIWKSFFFRRLQEEDIIILRSDIIRAAAIRVDTVIEYLESWVRLKFFEAF